VGQDATPPGQDLDLVTLQNLLRGKAAK